MLEIQFDNPLPFFSYYQIDCLLIVRRKLIIYAINFCFARAGEIFPRFEGNCKVGWVGSSSVIWGIYWIWVLSDWARPSGIYRILPSGFLTGPSLWASPTLKPIYNTAIFLFIYIVTLTTPNAFFSFRSSAAETRVFATLQPW